MSTEMLFSGGASGVKFTDLRDFYLNPNEVKDLVSNVTPFLTFTMQWAKRGESKDSLFKMFEYRPNWLRQYIYVGTGATVAKDDAEDSITISPTNSLGVESTFTNAIVGYKCRVFASDGKTTPKPTGDPLGTVIITTFTNATTVSVKCASRSAVTIPSPAFLEIVSQESAESSESPEGFFTQPKVVWNQVGMTRTSFSLSTHDMQSSPRAWNDKYMTRMRQAMELHKKHNENDLMFSTNTMGTNSDGAGTDTFTDGTLTDASGKVLRPTYGACSIIQDYGISDVTNDDQNKFTISKGAYTYDEWVDQTEKAFLYSDTQEETLFCGNGFKSFWSKLVGGGQIYQKMKWPQPVTMHTEKSKVFGWNYTTLETPNGVFNMVTTPSLQRSVYNNAAFMISADELVIVEDEADHYYHDILKDNNPRLVKSEFITRRGIGLTNLAKHKMFTIV